MPFIAKPSQSSQEGAIQTGTSSVNIGLLVVAAIIVPIVLAAAVTVFNPLYVAAIIGALIAAAFIAANPFVGLLLFVTLIFVRPEDVPGLGALQITLMVSVLTLAATWSHLFLKRQPIVTTPVTWLLLGFLAMAVLSTISDGDTVQAATDVSKLVILVVLIFNLVRTSQQSRIMCDVLVVLTCYVATRTLFLFYTGAVVLVDSGVARAQGTGAFANPNDLAAALLPGIAFGLMQAIRSNWGLRVLYGCSVALMVWALLLTNSRGGLIGLLIVLITTIVFSSRDRVRSIAIAVALSVLVFGLVGGRIKNFDAKEASANIRFQFWLNGITMVVKNPVTGVGYLGFDKANGGMDAHNTFVIGFAELGVIGYSCWIGSIYFCYRRNKRLPANTEDSQAPNLDLVAARIALGAYLAAGFFGNLTYIPLTYVLIGLPIACQIAASGSPSQSRLESSEYLRIAIIILALSIGSILFIRLFAQALV